MSMFANKPAISDQGKPDYSVANAALRSRPGGYRGQSSRRFGIMLLVALVSHLLLVWQLSWPPAPVATLEPAPLQLQLQRPSPLPEPAVPEPLEQEKTPAPDAVEPAMAPQQSTSREALFTPRPAEPKPAQPSTWETLDAPTLREQARVLLLERPGESLARPQVLPLARLRPPLPHTLTGERALPLIPTPFSEVYLTGETEIIDQWETPDGGREVILRAPNGQVVCGRRAAPELLEPLVQPIMLYRAC